MITPYALTCQRVKTPLAISGVPVVSWKLRSAEKNQRQTAYQLRAASSEDGLAQPDLYDSGKKMSADCLDIPMEREALPPYTRVYWNVTVWDQDDHAETSAPTWLETGPNPDDFTGKTIFAGEQPDKPYEKTPFATTAPALDRPAMPEPGPEDEGMPLEFTPTPRPEYYFRRVISVEKELCRARLYLAASGACLVRVNGAPGGKWINDPSPNMCSFRSLYTAYDLDGLMKPGDNALAISCAGANLTALVFLEYADGTQEEIWTDSTWHWTLGPTVMIGTGETYDASKEKPGWDLPDYQEDGWQPCGMGPDPLITMEPNLLPVQTVVWSEHPTNLERTEWGTWRCKASRITAGRVHFRLSAPKGTEIRLYMAEKELKNGEIIRGQDPLGNPEEGGSDCFTYIFAGDGIEEWAMRYSYSGIGWLEIQGYPGELKAEDIWFEAVLNQAERISEIESSEPMFTALHEMLIATIENNFHGVLTTCPPYEKGPADGDTSVTMPAFLWNLDCLPIVRRLDDDFAASIRQRVSYTLEDLQQDKVAPGMVRTVPEWSSMLVHNCWNLYCMSGTMTEAEAYQQEFRRYFQNELAELQYSDYLVDSFFGGDWNSPDGNGSPEGGTLSGTCYEAYSLRIMAELWDRMDQPELAKEYRLEAEKCARSINEKCLREDEYVTAKTHYFPQWGPPPWGGDGMEPLPVGYRQTSNVLPLAFDLVPKENRQKVIDRLIQEIHKKGDHLDTGFVGSKYLLTTLTELGYVELAYEIATKRDYPSWGYWLEQGATTCWEHWGKFSRSQDHFFLAAGLEDWFRESLAGIRAPMNGYQQFTVMPQIPEKLQRFGMRSDTARGTVASRWKKRDGQLILTLEIPVGSQANVILPQWGAGKITVDGEAREDRTFSLGSGRYEITME